MSTLMIKETLKLETLQRQTLLFIGLVSGLLFLSYFVTSLTATTLVAEAVFHGDNANPNDLPEPYGGGSVSGGGNGEMSYHASLSFPDSFSTGSVARVNVINSRTGAGTISVNGHAVELSGEDHCDRNPHAIQCGGSGTRPSFNLCPIDISVDPDAIVIGDSSVITFANRHNSLRPETFTYTLNGNSVTSPYTYTPTNLNDTHTLSYQRDYQDDDGDWQTRTRSCDFNLEVNSPTDLEARLILIDDQLATVPYDFTYSSAKNVGSQSLSGTVRVAVQFDYNRNGWDGNGNNNDFHIIKDVPVPQDPDDVIDVTFPGVVHNQAGDWQVRFFVDNNNVIEPAGSPGRANNTTSWRPFNVTVAPPANWCHRVEAEMWVPGGGAAPYQTAVKYYTNTDVYHVSTQSSTDNGLVGVNDDRMMVNGGSYNGDGYVWAVHYGRDDTYMEGLLPNPETSQYHGWINVSQADSATLQKRVIGDVLMVMKYRRNLADPACAPLPPVNAPTVTLTASPDSIIAGESSTLTWTVSNAEACVASPAITGWSGAKATTSGPHAQTINNIQNTTVYRIACVNASGVPATDDATVAVCAANYGNACTKTNSCGSEITSGTYQCNGSCSATTPSESSCTATYQCSDGIDNDGDGLIDHSSVTPAGETPDPGCSSPTDDDEFNAPPACTVDIDSNLSLGRVGDMVTINWEDCTAACTLSNNLSAPVTAGTENVTLQGTTIYSIDCGAVGQDEVTVTALPRVEEN